MTVPTTDPSKQAIDTYLNAIRTAERDLEHAAENLQGRPEGDRIAARQTYEDAAQAAREAFESELAAAQETPAETPAEPVSGTP
jgi:hypothetical protein